MENIVLLTSMALALIHGSFFRALSDNHGATITKVAPMLLLALFAHLWSGPWLLIAALTFSAMGDWALSRSGDRPFLIGLVSFAIAHILYICLFMPDFQKLQPVVITIFGGLAVSSFYWLIPNTGKLRFPVIIYITIISIMAITAFASGKSYLVLIGVCAFVLSDIMLSIGLFRDINKKTARLFSIGVWLFYYGGQLLITIGWIST